MHAASSVSELYAADEVDLLLDEIRHLEPTSCRPEELQDLEIAGSGCAGWEGGGSGAGLTPGTERSWDSHAGYRRAGVGAARALAPLYCGWRRLAGARGLAGGAALGAGAAAAALALGGAGRGGAAAPRALQAAARGVQAAALWAALLHAALLFAHVSRLAELLPLRWHLLTGVCAGGSGAAMLWAGAGALRALLGAPPPPPLLLAAASLCICGSVFSFVLLAFSVWGARRGASGAGTGAPRATAAYRAVPPRPPDDRP